MKKILLLLVIILLAGIPYIVHARVYDGNWALSNCSYFIDVEDGKIDKNMVTPAKNIDAMECAGYVAGFTESIYAYQLVLIGNGSQPSICLPDNVRNIQVTRIMLRFLRGNPEKLHWELESLLFKSLYDAFPCSDKK